jgi:hypothetical protein
MPNRQKENHIILDFSLNCGTLSLARCGIKSVFVRNVKEIEEIELLKNSKKLKFLIIKSY